MIELDCRRLDLPRNLAEQYAPQVAAALDQMARLEKGEKVPFSAHTVIRLGPNTTIELDPT